jgi:hypothetical protein
MLFHLANISEKTTSHQFHHLMVKFLVLGLFKAQLFCPDVYTSQDVLLQRVFVLCLYNCTEHVHRISRLSLCDYSATAKYHSAHAQYTVGEKI